MVKRKVKPKTIVLDFDDCIGNFLGYICFLHNSIHGTCLAESDIKTWDFEDIDFVDIRGNSVNGKQLEETFHKYEPHGLYACLPVIKDAKHAMQIMRKLGYKIIILTARKPQYEAPTLLNLINNQIPYDEIYFESDKVKKLKSLRRKYDIVLFADDKLETIVEVAENVKIPHICMIKKSHNKNTEIDEEIKVINTLFEAVRFLEDLEE